MTVVGNNDTLAKLRFTVPARMKMVSPGNPSSKVKAIEKNLKDAYEARTAEEGKTAVSVENPLVKGNSITILGILTALITELEGFLKDAYKTQEANQKANKDTHPHAFAARG